MKDSFMDEKLFLGIFSNENDILGATQSTRESGFKIHDVFTPYAVHGLDKAMGLKASWLTYACLIFAVAGLTLGLVVQFWIGSIDWPLNVGGKPFNSLPAYLPVMFEVTVLIGGLGVVFMLFVATKLYPGKKAKLLCEGITNNLFVIAVEQKDSSFDKNKIQNLWEKHNVLKIKYSSETIS